MKFDYQFDTLSEPSVRAHEPDQASTPARYGRKAVRWTEKYGVGAQSNARQNAEPCEHAREAHRASIPAHAGHGQPGGSRSEVVDSSLRPSGR